MTDPFESVYSHPSRSHRRAATFLCTRLASHGYVVAAMDHSESVVPELAPARRRDRRAKARAVGRRDRQPRAGHPRRRRSSRASPRWWRSRRAGARGRSRSIPLDVVREIFERTPEPKRMVILPRADHLHFMDGVEQLHESVRNMTLPGDLAWLPKEMLPMSELCSGEEAHRPHARIDGRAFRRGAEGKGGDARRHPEPRRRRRISKCVT